MPRLSVLLPKSRVKLSNQWVIIAPNHLWLGEGTFARGGRALKKASRTVLAS